MYHLDVVEQKSLYELNGYKRTFMQRYGSQSIETILLWSMNVPIVWDSMHTCPSLNV